MADPTDTRALQQQLNERRAAARVLRATSGAGAALAQVCSEIAAYKTLLRAAGVAVEEQPEDGVQGAGDVNIVQSGGVNFGISTSIESIGSIRPISNIRALERIKR